MAIGGRDNNYHGYLGEGQPTTMAIVVNVLMGDPSPKLCLSSVYGLGEGRGGEGLGFRV
jgi:hypothetical protein